MFKFAFPTVAEKELPLYFVRFYAVGLVLYMLPFTRELFILITPASLVLAIGVVFYFHRRWNVQTVLFFIFIMASSFFLEMVGTRTGLIFGAYRYERGLGIQLNHTPLLIGLNWLFLLYATRSLALRLVVRPSVRVAVAALLMVFYDVVLEWVAPLMQMWRFDSRYPPLRNFLAWFTVSLIYHALFELLPVHAPHTLAGTVWSIQVIFFVWIGLYSLFFIP